MRSRYSSTISFIDLAFNLLICFVCLFSVAFLVMSKKLEQDKKITAKAEFMITVTWPEESKNDVDTYVEDPTGEVSFFQAREVSLMHLDRDDLGGRNDTIMVGGERITVKENREIVTIRGIIPGEYTVWAHMYRRVNGEEEPDPTPVKVKVEKMNPSVKTIALKTVELGQNGDEKTAFRFTIDQDGDVTSTNTLPKAFPKDNRGTYDEEGEEFYEGNGGTLR